MSIREPLEPDTKLWAGAQMFSQPILQICPYDDGYVIEATWPGGKSETLVGVFVSQFAAQQWLNSGGALRWATQQRRSTFPGVFAFKLLA